MGKKLAATGNGRCNLTNVLATERDYHGTALPLLTAMLRRFPPESVMRAFENIGVMCRVEDAGRAYPMSDQASSVLDALRLSLQEAGVPEICDCELTELRRAPGGFRLTARDGRTASAARAILATGGLSAPSLGGSESGFRIAAALGHAVEKPFPSLVQIRTETEPIRALKGIRVQAELAIEVGGRELRRERGEVLFAEYGLSGIAAMQLSRIAGQACDEGQPAALRLRTLPLDERDALALLRRRQTALASRPLENFLTGMVNKRLGQTLIKLTASPDSAPGLLARPSSSLDQQQLRLLARLLTGWRLKVTGTQGFDQAQVTAGGVRGDQVDPESMRSLLVPGLYLAGELIDLDGDCGGYNLQWAWASGLLAGECCARSLEGKESD
mgnify:CR=1 FL=1